MVSGIVLRALFYPLCSTGFRHSGMLPFGLHILEPEDGLTTYGRAVLARGMSDTSRPEE